MNVNFIYFNIIFIHIAICILIIKMYMYCSILQKQTYIQGSLFNML